MSILKSLLKLLSLVLVFVFLTAAKSLNIPEICLDSSHKGVLDDSEDALGIPRGVIDSGSAQTIIDAFNRLPVQSMERAMTPWLLQDVSHPYVAQAAFMAQGLLAQELSGRVSPDDKIIEILNRSVRQPAHYSDAVIRQAKNIYARLQRQPVVGSLAKLKQASLVLCAPYYDIGCSSALRDGLDIMSTRIDGMALVSILPIIRRILLDDGLVQGSAHFALKTLARIKAGRQGLEQAPKLYDDLVQSFLATGSTQKKAEERAWILIAMYGTRGASLHLLEDLPNSENLPVFLNLYLFSGALALFDSATLQTGSPYSLPSPIKSRCAYRNPYHFWLSAYLTHALIAAGHGKRSSIIAVHLLAKLYEFESPTVSRYTLRPYRVALFHHYNNNIRTNIAFNDAGAFFGATGSSDPIDLDAWLAKMFEASRPMPDLTPEELERGLKNNLTRYGWFNRIMAPDIWIKSALEIKDEPLP